MLSRQDKTALGALGAGLGLVYLITRRRGSGSDKAAPADPYAQADPAFRPKLRAVVAALAVRGWLPVVGTWRSTAAQADLYRRGASHVEWSFHNALDARGRPAALAADISDRRWAAMSHTQRAAFLRDLGTIAKAQGLYWGGDWSRTNPVYAAPPYEMGWDPVHIQLYPNSALAEVRAHSGRAAYYGSRLGAALMIGGLAGAYWWHTRRRS